MAVFKKQTWYPDAPPAITDVELNRIDEGIFNAYFQSGGSFLEPNTTTDFIYSGGNLSVIDEKVAGVLRRKTTLSYVSGSLQTVNTKIYAEDGTTVIKDFTDNLTYSGNDLTKITRVVNI